MTIVFVLTSLSVSAKSLEIKIQDVRNDKGNVLVMAKIAGQTQPTYAMAPAKKGEVVVKLEGLDTDVAEVSIFHDEDANYQMEMGNKGPVEGYVTKKCKLPDEQNSATLKLYYPTSDDQ